MGYLDRLGSYKDDMIKTLYDSVAYPSVKAEGVMTESGEFLPFGKNVHDALLHMLETGKSMGFDIHNDDNYAGHIEFAPEGCDKSAGYFGIVGHLDVVPEGTGWDGDPYVMRESNGYLFGRGTSDDKGPVVAALYAMKALKEEGLTPRMPIRLVLGLDEETGDISAQHYTESQGHPAMGFTPDAEFPLVHGEMGILTFDLARKFAVKPAREELRLTRLEAGTAHNAVPATAKAVIAGEKADFDEIADKLRAYSEETGYDLCSKKQGSSLVIEAQGKAAHGAHPELGLNAASIMFDFLGRIGFACEELNELIAFYNEHIGFDVHGERMGCGFEDDKSGPLIFNVGVVSISEEIASLTICIRYPVSCTGDQVLGGIQDQIEGTSIGMVTRVQQNPIYMGLDEKLPAALLAAYREESGDEDTAPMVIGGGTYAKMFDNILAFGGMFPGEEDTMHQANEQFSIESFMRMARIYAKAIYTLCFE